MTERAILAEPVSSAARGQGGLLRSYLFVDAAWRLGPRSCALIAWHRLRVRTGLASWALGERTLPAGRLLPEVAPDGGVPGDAVAMAAEAEASLAAGWHGGFPRDVPALGLDLFAHGDIRPVWEANRLLALPLLALAARRAPGDGHLERAEALLRDWCVANPPFRGPAWACGQEAALRALHLCLALAVLEADRDPTPAMRALLGAHADRIVATPAYAEAQDNNHAVSEAAGRMVLGLVLGEPRLAQGGARRLTHSVTRLVAPDGSFAQASPGYHRLLLDTLAMAEWFRRRFGAPPLARPFAERARAATHWLSRVMEPDTGALPRCGPSDDSRLADTGLFGPQDARGSVQRAEGLFGIGPPEADTPPNAEPRRGGAGRLFAALFLARGLPPMPAWHQAGCWRSEGWFGARNARYRLLLRSGAPLRFRPGQADLLHLDLTLDGKPLLIDGGSGAYNPPAGCDWWIPALTGTAGHNTIQFDGQEQMPRLSRFLFARWPMCHALTDGAALRDHRGRVHRRHIHLAGGTVTVEDRVEGPFTRLVLRWRLAPGQWELMTTGVRGPRARITLTADAPFRIRLAQGWYSPAYGQVAPAPVLELTAEAPVSRLVTLVQAR